MAQEKQKEWAGEWENFRGMQMLGAGCRHGYVAALACLRRLSLRRHD